jgi:hypothetical protein
VLVGITTLHVRERLAAGVDVRYLHAQCRLPPANARHGTGLPPATAVTPIFCTAHFAYSAIPLIRIIRTAYLDWSYPFSDWFYRSLGYAYCEYMRTPHSLALSAGRSGLFPSTRTG